MKSTTRTSKSNVRGHALKPKMKDQCTVPVLPNDLQERTIFGATVVANMVMAVILAIRKMTSPTSSGLSTKLSKLSKMNLTLITLIIITIKTMTITALCSLPALPLVIIIAGVNPEPKTTTEAAASLQEDEEWMYFKSWLRRHFADFQQPSAKHTHMSLERAKSPTILDSSPNKERNLTIICMTNCWWIVDLRSQLRSRTLICWPIFELAKNRWLCTRMQELQPSGLRVIYLEQEPLDTTSPTRQRMS